MDELSEIRNQGNHERARSKCFGPMKHKRGVKKMKIEISTDGALSNAQLALAIAKGIKIGKTVTVQAADEYAPDIASLDGPQSTFRPDVATVCVAADARVSDPRVVYNDRLYHPFEQILDAIVSCKLAEGETPP